MSGEAGSAGGGMAKLPLWETIRLSYASYFGNFGDVLRISWLWIVVTAPLMGLASWLEYSWMARAIDDLKRDGTLPPDAPPAPPLPVAMHGIGLAASVIFVLALLSIAVAWHRRLILDERPGFSGSNVTSWTLWWYLGAILLVLLIGVLPLLLMGDGVFYLMHADALMGPPPRMVFALMFGVLIAVFAVLARLLLVLPARATGDNGVTIRDTWMTTRGNTWRLALGLAATVVLPLFLVRVLLAGMAGFPAADLLKLEVPAFKLFAERGAAANMAGVAFYLLILPIGIGFLSHAYRHFFPRA